MDDETAFAQVRARMMGLYAGEPGGEEGRLAARRMHWVSELDPGASEECRLAALGLHLGRWEHPRSAFPAGRSGYLRWRTRLYGIHAGRAQEIALGAGYPEERAALIAQLVGKRAAATAEGQLVEDAACLAFLEEQLGAFSGKTPTEKVIDVLRKTWRKMSPAARERALALSLAEGEREMVERALAGAGGEGDPAS